MENVEEYLHQALVVVIFSLALGILFNFNNNLLMLLSVVKSSIIEEDILYKTTNTESRSHIYSYHELIADISGFLEYDVEVDGMLIEADIYNYMSFDYSLISIGNYKKSYVISNGKIAKIIYNISG